MDRRLVLTGLGAGALALGGVALFGRGGASQLPLLPGVVSTAHAQAAPQVADMVMGEEGAPVTVIEYASFTCPHCANFHANVFPRLKADYVETGRVRYVYREVYFDRFGLWAAMVARCAGPVRYFGVVDLIYDNQRDWVQGEPATVAENLRRLGRSAGLSDGELDACLTDGVTAQALVDHYEANMAEYPIEGTPSFVIDGELYSNMSYESFAGILDERLAAAE